MFEASNFVLLVKGKANDSWAKIEKGLKTCFGSHFCTKPFCGNMVVVLCEDFQKWQAMFDFKKGPILNFAFIYFFMEL